MCKMTSLYPLLNWNIFLKTDSLIETKYNSGGCRNLSSFRMICFRDIDCDESLRYVRCSSYNFETKFHSFSAGVCQIRSRNTTLMKYLQ